MATNLILTGWGKNDYFAAAAAAYGSHGGDADVYGVSMSELAATLESRGPRYARVDILGVGLTENLARLAAALAALGRKRVSVRWVSRLAMPEEARAALKEAGASFAEEIVDEEEGVTLTGLVAARYPGVPPRARRRLEAVAARADLSLEDYARGYRLEGGARKELIAPDVWTHIRQAAGFAHRDFGDDLSFGLAVKALWEDQPVQPKPPAAFAQILANYKAGFADELIGKSACTHELRECLQRASRYDGANVLILGETGVGKEIAARYIHSHSDRRDKPFVEFNCACVGGKDMLMDRLFGHEAGAFTDAKEARGGLFDDARDGTLFLDEIGEAPPDVQAMLLKVIEDGTFTRIGGGRAQEVKVSVRLVCATNQDLQQMVLDRRFRLDLYERICGIPIRIVPLRRRKGDIELLAKHFWRKITGGKLTKRQVTDLAAYDYPGNVRELWSLLKQAAAMGLTDFARLLAEHREFNRKLIAGLERAWEGADAGAGAPDGAASPAAAAAEAYPDDEAELLRRHAEIVYARHGRNLAAAAKAAGISVNTLKKRLAAPSGGNPA